MLKIRFFWHFWRLEVSFCEKKRRAFEGIRKGIRAGMRRAKAFARRSRGVREAFARRSRGVREAFARRRGMFYECVLSTFGGNRRRAEAFGILCATLALKSQNCVIISSSSLYILAKYRPFPTKWQLKKINLWVAAIQFPCLMRQSINSMRLTRMPGSMRMKKVFPAMLRLHSQA